MLILRIHYSFLEDIPLSYLHVFTFSERPDTIAEKLPAKVPFTRKGKEKQKAYSSFSEEKS